MWAPPLLGAHVWPSPKVRVLHEGFHNRNAISVGLENPSGKNISYIVREKSFQKIRRSDCSPLRLVFWEAADRGLWRETSDCGACRRFAGDLWREITGDCGDRAISEAKMRVKTIGWLDSCELLSQPTFHQSVHSCRAILRNGRGQQPFRKSGARHEWYKKC